jgi:general secretion pathway protein J
MNRQSGFTLLEVLVALVVLGLLLAGITQSVQFGLHAWFQQARDVARHQDLAVVERTLRGLIERMEAPVPGAVNTIPSGPDRLAVTTELPLAVATPMRRADVMLGVDAAHRLVLRWTPHLHAIRIGAAPRPQESELLRGLDHMEVAYWGADSGGRWTSRWDARVVPALVRIRLAFPKGDPRHWPDIVVTPMRGWSDE